MSSGWLQNACNSPTPDDMRIAFAFNRVGCRGQYSVHTSGTSTSVIGIFNGDLFQGVPEPNNQLKPYCDEGYMECYAHHPEIFPPPTEVPACPSEFGFIPKEVECPTNACLYTARLDPCAVYETNLGIANSRTGASRPKCDKTQWDSHWKLDCCLGIIDSNPTYTSVTTTLCDPRWCPNDPTGVCSTAIFATCSATYTQADGSVMPLALKEGHACNVWYANAVQEGFGERLAVVSDLGIEFCGKYPDSPACACLLSVQRAQKGCTTPPCDVPYTSLTNGNPAAVGFADGASNPPMPVNVVDHVCLVPQCGLGNVLTTYGIE